MLGKEKEMSTEEEVEAEVGGVLPHRNYEAHLKMSSQHVEH